MERKAGENGERGKVNKVNSIEREREVQYAPAAMR